MMTGQENVCFLLIIKSKQFQMILEATISNFKWVFSTFENLRLFLISSSSDIKQ
jgi:hypothetical protein